MKLFTSKNKYPNSLNPVALRSRLILQKKKNNFLKIGNGLKKSE